MSLPVFQFHPVVTSLVTVPISTYILSGKHSLPKSVFDVINDRDGQICDNLIYLGEEIRSVLPDGQTMCTFQE